MPKTDVKKIESEDVAELSDEALDRTEDKNGMYTAGVTQGCTCVNSAPA
ncbi:MAG: hypothetical protein ISR48_06195 [Alphaproteobacteria bacterium]|nr:hypothetical protein [Alphaproteobacteria bacterium]